MFFVVLGTSAALDSTAIPEPHLYGSEATPRDRLVEAHRTSQFYNEKKKTVKYTDFSLNISEAKHKHLHPFVNVGNFNILKTHIFSPNISCTKRTLYTGFLASVALFAGKHKLFLLF